MRTLIKLLLVVLALGWMADQAEAQRRGGGRRGGGMRGGGGFGGGGGFRSAGLGGGFARAGSRPSINARPSQLPSRHVDVGRAGRPDIGAPGRPDIGQPGRPNYDRDFNYVDRDIYVDRDFDVGDDWWDYDDRYDGCCYHPVARAAAWGAAATAVSYGSSAYALPSDCVSTVVNGITYYQCGSAWYQPQFQGTTVNYVAASPPR